MLDEKDFLSIEELANPQSIEIPEELPLMPVRDLVVFPSMIVPLLVGREASVMAVNEALASNRLLFLLTQKDSTVENPQVEDFYNVGVVSMIVRMLHLPDGRIKILAQALLKAEIEEFTKIKPYFSVKINAIKEEEPTESTIEMEALKRNVREQAEQLFLLKGIFNPEMGTILNNVEEFGRLSDVISSNLRLKVSEAQKILEIQDPLKRLQLVNELLTRELEVSSVQAKIQSEAKEEMTKSQKEFYLREQLRAIQRELGDIDDKFQEIQTISQQIIDAKMPVDVEEDAFKQLKRLEMMHPDSSESTVVRNYLDWLVELPWSKTTKDKLDITHAKKILDEDHYDLEKIKDRILEFIAVRKLNKQAKGSILCFVGPPGVGKTSLGRSIARALGKKFVRVSLGGLKDEAEIRGHRRTYIGALPGKIIGSMKKAGSNNPVFMMDEVDKIGSDFRGDPASALLEVLDPEQNSQFVDHFLDVPFDLSKVLFILTANTVDTIPHALLDRLEMLNLSGYTNEEKLKIANKYIITKQIKENGLNPDFIVFKDESIKRIISEYTKEAGLRELERKIGSVCRKVARLIAEKGQKKYIVTSQKIEEYLGIPKYLNEKPLETSLVGVSIGLAWTPYGGDIINIEATIMSGKGNMLLTGLLGDVMKESAQAALSYIRSRAEKLGIDPLRFEKTDIHIHIPAGSIPKDGPSAGITMTTALVSAFTERPVNKDIAMTGEITLRGRVLPIGGLKEKSLAALRGGIDTIIIPDDNIKDLEEIPKDIRSKINFIPVRDMDEVIKNSLL